MKNKTISTILLIFIIISFAQSQTNIDWNAPNATWVYSMISMSSVEYYKLQQVGDTIIANQDVKKIDVWNISFYSTHPVVLGRHDKYVRSEYMYESNDSIFRYQDSTFVLLYDFGAQAGESWIVHGNDNHICHQFANADTDTIMVEENTIEQYENYNLETMTISDGGNWSLGSEVIKGIGSLKTPFPQSVNCNGIIDGGVGYYQWLSCYHNSEAGFINNLAGGGGDFCFDLITDNDNVISTDVPIFFPNPTPSIIYFSNKYKDKNFKLKIFDVYGKLHLTIPNASDNIDIKHLPRGIYFVNIFDEKGLFFTEQIIKM